MITNLFSVFDPSTSIYNRKVINKAKRVNIINTTIKNKLGQVSVAQELERKELKWYGHSIRINKKEVTIGI